MKVTVVPAQITTVEDRVAANLSFTQLILCALPVFGGSLLYAALPPSMAVALYKVVLVCLIAVCCLTMAIRIKGKIILLWLIVLVRYGLRPRQYVFNKNTNAEREQYVKAATPSEAAAVKPAESSRGAPRPKLALREVAIASARLDDPLSRTRFETTKKGGLHVHLAKTQD